MSTPHANHTAGHAPGADHNHDRCIADALTTATELCADRGTRLTPIRRRVLELIWRSHRPVGAYALLDELRTDGRSAAPPTVYRALDFLIEQGLIHRLDTLNAFLGCIDPRHPHQGHYLICEECHSVTEIAEPEVAAALAKAALAHGFTVRRQTVEMAGTCRRCAPQA
jgi:Fur family zinc uptake transcriptional regulator